MNSTQYAQAILNGGITLKGNEVAYHEHGYMVSLKGYELQVPLEQLGLDVIHEYQQEYEELLENHNFGIWIDDDMAYLDISVHIEDLQEAMQVGKENNQISIYDIANNKAITL